MSPEDKTTDPAAMRRMHPNDVSARDLDRWADEIERLGAALRDCAALLRRYHDETPLGHQPHMIAHAASAAIQRAEAMANG